MFLGFNRAFNISPKGIEDIVIRERLSSSMTIILKIKKPDYLGSSKWEFRYKKIKIEANILDLDWLSSFQKKEITLGPGDALKVIFEVDTAYDRNSEVISSQYTINQVLEVISASSAEQKKLIDEFESEDDILF